MHTSITNEYIPVLNALNTLPLNDKRRNDLLGLKNGSARREIFRTGLICSEIPYVIGCGPAGNAQEFRDAKLASNESSKIYNYGKSHERDSKQEFMDHMKVIPPLYYLKYSLTDFLCYFDIFSAEC